METIKHNIEREQLLVDLLGYTLEGPDEQNAWIIYDERKNPVGRIQYKKFNNGNERNGFKKVFGYCTSIDSDKIFFKSNRKDTDNNKKYDFDIKRAGKESIHAVMDAGKFPCITLWNYDGNKSIDMFTTDSVFAINLEDETDSFRIEESVVCKNWANNEEREEYIYRINANKKDKRERPYTIDKQIGAWTTKGGKITVRERTYKDSQLTDVNLNIFRGTVQELAEKNDMGIDAFNRFRYLLDKMLPFKEDIIPILLSDSVVKRNRIEMFVPKEDEAKKKILN